MTDAWVSGSLLRAWRPEGARQAYEGGTLDVTCIEVFELGLAVRYALTFREDYVPPDWEARRQRAETGWGKRPPHIPAPTHSQIENDARAFFLSEVTLPLSVSDDLGTEYRRVGNAGAMAGPSVLLGTWALLPSLTEHATALIVRRDAQELLSIAVRATQR